MFQRAVPVVMYHHVLPVEGGLSVTPEKFEDHLRVLQVNGWKTLSGEEFLYSVLSGNVPKKSVLLTFDDGFADNYLYAFPLLKRYRMKAVMFVASSFIENKDIRRENFIPHPHSEAWRLACTGRRSEVMCTWNELKEMEDSGIFDIQSHGHSHRIPYFIKEKNYTEINNDLFTGKKMLGEMLSKEIEHLAWPKGCYNQAVIDIASEAGFKAIYTTERGANTKNDLQKLNRLPVKGDGRWLIKRLNIYSSVFLSKLYLAVRMKI